MLTGVPLRALGNPDWLRMDAIQALGNDSASPFPVEERVIVPTNFALHVVLILH